MVFLEVLVLIILVGLFISTFAVATLSWLLPWVAGGAIVYAIIKAIVHRDRHDR